MMRILLSWPFLGFALLIGCASPGNGQIPKTAPEHPKQAAVPEQAAAAEPAALKENELVASKESPVATAKGETPRASASPEALRECEKCNGKWGKHGLARVESCLCRTADFGKSCQDGDDCQGKCLVTDSEFKCSEFVTVFGCHAYLPKGWSKKSDKEKKTIPTICVD
jgi:hypothetical protein